MFLPHLKLNQENHVPAVAPVRASVPVPIPAPVPVPVAVIENPPRGQGDFLDDNNFHRLIFLPDSVQEFQERESVLLRFARALELERSAVIGETQYTIEPYESGFKVTVSHPEREPREVVCGRYGFSLDTFDRALSWSVDDARETFSCSRVTMDNGTTIEKRYHNRRAEFVYVVLHAEPLGNRFESERERAKKLGGWYSREYRPEFCSGGFMFPDYESAFSYANRTRGARGFLGGAKPPAAPKAAPVVERVDTADKLETLADGMDDIIQRKLRPMTQNWTAKRGREYASRQREGEQLQRCQLALRTLARHHRAGTVPAILNGLTTKSNILPMMSCRSDNGEYYDQSAQAVALRHLMAQSETTDEQEQRAAEKRRREISDAENNLRQCTNDGFFPTPAPLAQRVVKYCGMPATLPPDFRALEPSAGIGSLCDALRAERPDVEIVAVERLQDAANVCELKGYDTRREDFLSLSVDTLGMFDIVAMNPPFERHQDIDHVQHAWQFVKPGGRLVAIMCSSSFHDASTRRKVQEFQQWFSEVDGDSWTIHEAFKGPESFRQTGISVELVVIRKPE